MNKRVDYLIISNSNDFTSDFICIRLNKLKKRYLRINRDEFSEYNIVWNINTGELNIVIEGVNYLINNTLEAIYYRAPVYIRYYSKSTKEDQLYKSQWMAFIKNLMYFDNAIWINNPAMTYKAENKMLQLKYAKQIGFNIPMTRVINSSCDELESNTKYIIKSIDTLLLRYDEKEAFLYSNILEGSKINSAELNLSPIVVQEFLNPKIDLRVTVIKDQVYTAKIVKDGKGVYDDWRKEKDNVKFLSYKLPRDIEEKCILLVKKLGLIYGGIDLAIVNDKYYFIEINPTGEWAWLIDNPGFNIDEKIVDVLIGQ